MPRGLKLPRAQLELCDFFRSTTERASDVSLSHLFHPFPLHLPVALLVWLFGLESSLFCFLVSLFCKCKGFPLVISREF